MTANVLHQMKNFKLKCEENEYDGTKSMRYSVQALESPDFAVDSKACSP
jgi:hypothetical protein